MNLFFIYNASQIAEFSLFFFYIVLLRWAVGRLDFQRLSVEGRLSTGRTQEEAAGVLRQETEPRE